MRFAVPIIRRTLSALAAVLACAIPALPARAESFNDFVAGTFIGTAHAPAIPVPVHDILTLRADGTFTGTAFDDFGLGDIATNGFNSPEHGAWRQIGPGKIGTSSLSLGYDANGVHTTFARVNSQGTFSEDMQTLSGRFEVLIFQATQNPLTDEPVAVLPGTYSVGRNGEPHAPDEIGARLAGTYYGTGTGEGLSVPIVDLWTFHADGTYIANGNNGFGFGNIATNGFDSPFHGVWRQTGPADIATSALLYSYDANGAFQNIFDAVSASTLADDSQTVAGAFHVNVFTPDQDPLADDPVGMVLPGNYSVRRIAPSDTGTDFGRQIAGTYFGLATAEGIEVPIVDILTFGADGTFIGTANDDFGFGDLATNGFNSPEHGTWRQTGPNSISTSSLSLSFDANGAPEGTFQVTSDATFSPDWNTISGTFTVHLFAPDQDPLTDTPFATLPGAYELQRLTAVPEPSTFVLALLMVVTIVYRTRAVQ